ERFLIGRVPEEDAGAAQHRAGPSPAPRPFPGRRLPEALSAASRVGADEAGDHAAELAARIFLREVAGARDHRMLDAGSARHGALPDRCHRAGDRIAVAERHEERLVPGGQLAPGSTVGGCRRVKRQAPPPAAVSGSRTAPAGTPPVAARYALPRGTAAGPRA